MTVLAQRIILGWDCRKLRVLRELAKRMKLRPGRVLVVFNRALTMARIVDGVGAIFSPPPAPYGKVFSPEKLAELSSRGFGFTLEKGRAVRPRMRKAA